MFKIKGAVKLEKLQLHEDDVLVTADGKDYRLPTALAAMGKQAAQAVEEGTPLPTKKAPLEELLTQLVCGSAQQDLVDKVLDNVLQQLRQAGGLEDFVAKVSELAASKIPMNDLADAVADEIAGELTKRLPRALAMELAG